MKTPAPQIAAPCPSRRADALARRFAPRAVIGRLALILAVATTAWTAQAAFGSASGAKVSVVAKGPGGYRIEGKSSRLQFKESGGVLQMSLPVKSLKTGMGVRDDHLWEALGAEKHPIAKLRVQRSELKLPADGKSLSSTANAELTLNGVKGTVPIQYSAARKGSDYQIDAHGKIHTPTFKIAKQCYLGVCVDEQVKLSAKFKVRDN